MKKYTIGVDFGTLSARAVLLDIETGEEIAGAEFAYPHGIMSQSLPCGVELEADVALQHPQDYIDALKNTVHGVITQSGINKEQVVGICVDFTACTVLPVDKNFTPLCFDKKYENTPYAYAKLWKHHAAQKQADRITELAKAQGAEWLAGFGGTVPSEWLLPKILETLEKEPDIYDAAEYFVEAGDWLTWLLTGKKVRSACMAGFKGLWRDGIGYLDKKFLSDITPEFENIY